MKKFSKPFTALVLALTLIFSVPVQRAYAYDVIGIGSLILQGISVLSDIHSQEEQREEARLMILHSWVTAANSSTSTWVEVDSDTLHSVVMELARGGMPCRLHQVSHGGATVFVVRAIDEPFDPVHGGNVMSNSHITGCYLGIDDIQTSGSAGRYVFYSLYDSSPSSLDKIRIALQGLVTSLNTWHSQISGYVYNIAGSLDTISRRVIKTVGDSTYTIPDLTYNAWQQLRTIVGYVDGLESSLDVVSRRLIKTVGDSTYTIPDLTYNAWQQLRTNGGYLDDVEGYIDQIEGRMLKKVGDSSYTVADLNYNAWQQISNANDKLSLLASKLDTVIDYLSQHTIADVTVDLGDVTLSPDDSELTAYAKVIAFGQVDMYSILGSISAEYRDATKVRQTKFDTILSKYWYAPGAAPASLWVTGDQLRNIQQRMVEIGYPCSIFYDEDLSCYVIKLVGNPRVADVLWWSNTSIYSGKQDLYDSATTFYLTQGGFLLKASGKASILAFEDFTTELTYHITYMSGQLDAQLASFADGVDRLDRILELLEDNFSYSSSDHQHHYESEVVQEATCTAPGLMSYKCSECGFTYSDILPSLGHDWDLTEHGDAVFDEEGNELSSQYDIYTCTRCGVTQRTYDGSKPDSGSNTPLSELIANIFARLGSFVGGLFSTIFDLFDRLFSGFDSLVSSFNERAQQIASFGGEYPSWLGGIWEVVPDELQIALGFCLVVSLIGIVGKKLIFTT